MRYYVASDIHGFFGCFTKALEEKGYFSDRDEHKLIILGDLFDRGMEAKELQEFVLEQMEARQIILIRGNHEDLFERLVTVDEGLPYEDHLQNGTYLTALLLTGFEPKQAANYQEFAAEARATPFYRHIIPAMLNYYETNHYVFTHGWVPCIHEYDGLVYDEDWRTASLDSWEKARWYNGMDAAESFMEKKTVVCGHSASSYGHAKFEGRGTVTGPEADHSPYYGEHVIAIDAHTAVSQTVNVIVLED